MCSFNLRRNYSHSAQCCWQVWSYIVVESQKKNKVTLAEFIVYVKHEFNLSKLYGLKPFNLFFVMLIRPKVRAATGASNCSFFVWIFSKLLHQKVPVTYSTLCYFLGLFFILISYGGYNENLKAVICEVTCFQLFLYSAVNRVICGNE